MKKRIHTELLAVVICLLTGSIFTSTAQTQSDYLHQGLEAEQAQEYEKALEIWFDARQDLDIPSFQISTEYLRVVTEQELRDYYPMAFAMYQWGSSAEAIAPNRDALADEISRIAPITEEEQTEYWKTLLKDENPDLYREIEFFWEDLNSLPINNYNPRLLEHWERIAYARENFTAQEIEPYGTDIRGDFYVKYGAPNKKGVLDLDISRGDVENAFSNLSVLRTSSTSQNNRSSTFTRSSQRMSRDNLDVTDKIFELQQRGKAHIWSYDAGTEADELNVKLIFREKQNGEIERVRVIDDLIPSSAFNASGFEYQQRQRPVGNLMQWIYYQRLQGFDSEYASILSSMEADLFSTLPPQTFTSSGLNFKMLNRARADRELKQAPNVISTDFHAAYNIPMEIHQYRMLNEENEPVFITYIENRPLDAFYLDVIHNNANLQEKHEEYLDDIENRRFDTQKSSGTDQELIADDYLQHYQLRNTIDLRDRDQTLVSRSHINPVLVVDEEDYSTPSVSVFEIPYLENETEQIFYSELRNLNQDSNPAMESTLPKNLRGLGQMRIEQPDHWDMQEDNLLVSDLIIGFQKHDELEEIDIFPFIVSNDRKIPSDKPMIIHFEAYQLGTDDQGLSRFEVDYSFSTVSRFFNLFGSELEGISSTLTYEHDENRFSESLELQTTDMAPGKYDLSFTVTDRITGDSVERNIRLEVIDNSEFYVTEN